MWGGLEGEGETFSCNSDPKSTFLQRSIWPLPEARSQCLGKILEVERPGVCLRFWEDEHLPESRCICITLFRLGLWIYFTDFEMFYTFPSVTACPWSCHLALSSLQYSQWSWQEEAWRRWVLHVLNFFAAEESSASIRLCVLRLETAQPDRWSLVGEINPWALPWCHLRGWGQFGEGPELLAPNPPPLLALALCGVACEKVDFRRIYPNLLPLSNSGTDTG